MKVWHSIEVEIARVAESTAATTQLWAHQTTGFEVSEDSAHAGEGRSCAPTSTPRPTTKAIRREHPSRTGAPGVARVGADPPVDSLTIADQDWLAEWKKGYEPVRDRRSGC
jgi:hypothetical protein